MRRAHEGAYAILRYDGVQGPNARPEAAVTVKEVVRSMEEAEAGVARLNALNEHKGARYWWQYTRLLSEGDSPGTKRVPKAPLRGESMNTSDSIFQRALSKLLTEIFDGPPGGEAYLFNPGDPGLLGQLETVSASAASKRPMPGKTTIASHVDHV